VTASVGCENIALAASRLPPHYARAARRSWHDARAFYSTSTPRADARYSARNYGGHARFSAFSLRRFDIFVALEPCLATSSVEERRRRQEKRVSGRLWLTPVADRDKSLRLFKSMAWLPDSTGGKRTRGFGALL